MISAIFAVRDLLLCQVTLLNLLIGQSPRELEPGKLQPANPKLDLAQEQIQFQAVALCRASLPKPKALHSDTTLTDVQKIEAVRVKMFGAAVIALERWGPTPPHAGQEGTLAPSAFEAAPAADPPGGTDEPAK